MTHRAYNFSAGPAILPEPVLKQVQQDVWDIADSGIGIMEHSHRGPVFDQIVNETIADCRDLAGIPDHYHVLFLQGGASSQFFMIPMNFLKSGVTADYLHTGAWSKKAIKEAKLFGEVNIASSSEDENFTYIPSMEEMKFSANPEYVHMTSNNTIAGTEYGEIPQIPGDSPLMCDASSDIFSRPIDISRFGMVYAGAQKNLGPAGVTLVIIRDDLIEKGSDQLPTMLQYRTHSSKNSMFNTPPAMGIYVMGLVFKWIKSMGGLEAMAAHNQKKAAIIYDYLDNSDFFRGTAREDSRSLMNITFRGPNEDLEKQFIAESAKQGLKTLKGHRSVGGMRASIYNAFPIEGCQALVDFMKQFEMENR